MDGWKRITMLCAILSRLVRVFFYADVPSGISQGQGQANNNIIDGNIHIMNGRREQRDLRRRRAQEREGL